MRSMKFNQMYQYLLRSLLVLTFLLILTVTHAQRKYSNEFLNIGVGGQSHGLSGAMTAHTNDVFSTFWNPAGLTQLDAPFQVGAMHAEWFGGIAGYDYLGFAKPLNSENKSVMGLSLIRLGIDDIPYTLNLVEPDGTINYDNLSTFSTADYGIFLSYAREIKIKGKTLSVGGNAKVIRRVIGQIGGSWGFGLDIGAQYKSGPWQFAFMGKDITSTFNAWSFTLTDQEKETFVITDNDVPESSIEITTPTFILGTAYSIKFGQNYSLLSAMDLNFTTDGQRNVLVSSKAFNIDPHLGFQLNYKKFLFLRAGVGNFQRAKDDINGEKEILTVQPNFGVGFKLGKVKLDYALTDIGDASQVEKSHIFSLTLDLKGKK
ncbi:MAG: hypothetical protein ACI8P3_003544 [Saprospiraceae bacterium]|jgi:hypothetical protein